MKYADRNVDSKSKMPAVTNNDTEAANIPDPERVTLAILSDVTAAQAAHGLKHSDYDRYRTYCTRRLSKVRTATATAGETTDEPAGTTDEPAETTGKPVEPATTNASVIEDVEGEGEAAPIAESKSRRAKFS